MWEEDPRWQQAHYKVFIYAICVFTLLVPLVSLCMGDWSLTRSYFMGLGILTASLCVCAALIWTAIHLVMWMVWLCKRFLGRAHRR